MTTPVIAPATCPPSFVAPGSHLPSLLDRSIDSGFDVWKATVEGMTDYWTGALTRGAGPLDVASDVARWWQVTTDRSAPEWATPHEVVLEGPVARLRDFSAGSSADVVPTLVFPPQAGHDSCIVDYSHEQSQMKVIQAAGLTRAYSLDWIGATEATKNAGVEDYLAFIERAIAHIGGGPVNFVGDCQGGWLAAIYAALHPEQVNTLTLAGAPIDFHEGNPVIGDYVEMNDQRGDLSFYKSVVDMGGGVLKGEFMLAGFITIKPDSEVEKQVQLLAHINEEKHIERYRAFEDWFKHTQNVPGAFYLWIVEHLFRDNKLVRGELEIGGKRVDLGKIKAPLFLLGGDTDHITPPAQVFALEQYASVPASKVVKRTTSGGHLGLFMGSEALREHWPPILAEVFAHSKKPVKEPEARKARAKTRAKRETPKRTPAIPAP
jgi:poly(3-hydroxybutyrate) depolymerase